MTHRLALSLPLLAAAAGCILPERSHVRICYYSIDPAAPRAAPRAPHDLSLAVRSLDSASRYRDNVLHRPRGSAAVAYHDCQRWVEPPAEMVTRALRRALEAARVAAVVADDRLVRRADILVDGTLTRFDEVHDEARWTAECELELVVKRAEHSQVLLATRLAADRPAKEKTTASFVEAMNAAVADLVAQAADAVGKALAAPGSAPSK